MTGRWTGQIWVTSSRPISSGGSSAADARLAQPGRGGVDPEARAANSGVTGASSETASAIMYTVPASAR